MRITGRDDDDRKIFVDERVGPVLHLAGGISFGVNVGDFFQLQRAFERDGVVNTTPEKKKILRTRVQLGKLLTSFLLCQDVFELAGQASQFVYFRLRLLGRDGPAYLREVQREQVERGQLRCEC